MKYTPTHNCGELRSSNIGQIVRLSGWVHKSRNLGGFLFIDIRDRFGITQLVCDSQKQADLYEKAEKVHSEWVITITGTVIERLDKNKTISTGEIEINLESIEILSKSKVPPFSISDDFIDVNEELKLRYRYLDIRRGNLQQNLILRHKAMLVTRNFFDSKNFLEIQTPILAKSTPEGARDYLVPSRIYPGTFYALPQSPQIFKQLLMIAGMDRYFQIAPCFRDEDLRSSRQPEFTQIDVEMSFSDKEGLFLIFEDYFKTLFKECLNINLNTPFKRMTYHQVIDKYGTDKPDLRFKMELVDITTTAKKSSLTVFNECNGIIKGLCVKGGSDISRKGIEKYTNYVNELGIKGLAWVKLADKKLQGGISKFFDENLSLQLIEELDLHEGDLAFIIADTKNKTNQALDHLRRQIAKDRNLIKKDLYEFLWVTDFPLFERDEETNKISSLHHPFTAPHPDDLNILNTKPEDVRSLSYDIVLNGYELGSGSQRIHSQDLQKKIFKILELSEHEINDRFGFFAEALQYGTPPHIGMGLGLDRIMMILTGTDNIRDVIAFPKTTKAADVMMSAPSTVDAQQLDDLKIKTKS